MLSKAPTISSTESQKRKKTKIIVRDLQNIECDDECDDEEAEKIYQEKSISF